MINICAFLEQSKFSICSFRAIFTFWKAKKGVWSQKHTRSISGNWANRWPPIAVLDRTKAKQWISHSTNARIVRHDKIWKHEGHGLDRTQMHFVCGTTKSQYLRLWKYIGNGLDTTQMHLLCGTTKSEKFSKQKRIWLLSFIVPIARPQSGKIHNVSTKQCCQQTTKRFQLAIHMKNDHFGSNLIILERFSRENSINLGSHKTR